MKQELTDFMMVPASTYSDGIPIYREVRGEDGVVHWNDPARDVVMKGALRCLRMRGYQYVWPLVVLKRWARITKFTSDKFHENSHDVVRRIGRKHGVSTQSSGALWQHFIGRTIGDGAWIAGRYICIENITRDQARAAGEIRRQIANLDKRKLIYG